MIWPTRAAFSANNFLDHFPGSSLNARWTAVTSGTGTTSVTDSYVECNIGASGNASFIYNTTKLDKTKSQLWMICFTAIAANNNRQFFTVVNKTTAPVADTYTNLNPSYRIFASTLEGAGTNEIRFDYYDTGHAVKRWDGPGSAWGTVDPAYSPVRANDYYILGFEIDGSNSKWRLMGWCKTYTGGYTFEQGLRMFALTDWVAWSSLEATTDLWLVLGTIITDGGDTNGYRFEWVRYAENNTPMEAWVAAKATLADVHNIRHYYSHDGLVFVPEDRYTWALNTGGAPPDEQEVQEPCVVYDGATTDYMFYDGASNVPPITHTICVAKATHTTPQNGAWTRGASNPILNVSGTAEAQLQFPFVLMDKTESNANKRWKMLYTAQNSVTGKYTLYYATAPDPPDTSTWTRQGQVLGLGGYEAADEFAARDAVAIWVNGLWEVWYEGWAKPDPYGVNGTASIMRASGTDLASLTKDGFGPRVPAQAKGSSPLTANLTGRTVTVESTEGFVVDGAVVIDQDAGLDDYGASRIRKVTSATQLELYHGLDGFTTVVPATLRQLDAVKRITLRAIMQVGSEWWFYMVNWGIFDDLPIIRGLCEQITLYTHSAALPHSATPIINQLAAPVISRGFNNDQRSPENMSLLHSPFSRVAPEIIQQPGFQSVRVGDKATFTVTAITSGGTLLYDWEVDTGGGFVNAAGTQNQSTYQTPTLVIGDEGAIYRCNVTDNNGTTVSASATLHVRALTYTSLGGFDPELLIKAWF